MSQVGVEAGCIFGTFGREFDETFARQLGLAIGTRMGGGRLVVGGDTRPSTPVLKTALIDSLVSTGCEVYDVGILPTPALYFAKDRYWADGAVMITGSHRSWAENGFEITLGKLPTSENEIRELLQVVEQGGPFASGLGQVSAQDSLEPYASFLVARFVPAQPLRVVVDTGNGAMQQLASPIMRYLGYEVIERTYDLNQVFVPDPCLPENKAMLSRIVLDNQASMGVAFDGDGDQVVFFDEQGRELTPELVLILLVQALLAYQPGSQVVYDTSYAPFIFSAIRQLGGTPTPLAMTATELKRAFLERGAILGGDRWGHYYFRAMGGDDALYAALVLLRFISRTEGGIEPLIAGYL